MTGYTKLFGSIITSTIWREKNETRILWITMLALKNKEGIVEGSVPGLADMARLSVEDTVTALDILRSPDAHSRTKEHEGRRIQDVDGGWLVLNHAKWRAKMNADERRDYLRIKKQESRANQSTNVNKRQRPSTPSTHTEADTDTKKKRAPISDEEWRAGLKTDIAYRHIDIPAEFSKWQRWCARNKKTPTQARFEAWLNRIEKPVRAFAGASTVKSSVAPSEPPLELTDEQIEANKAFIRESVDKLKESMGQP